MPARKYHRTVGQRIDREPGPVRRVPAGPTLWQLTAPHFCAGLEVRHGRVTLAAPILQWTVGRLWGEVRAYARRKGWHGVPVTIPPMGLTVRLQPTDRGA